MRDVTDGSSTTQYPTTTTSGYPTTTSIYHVELRGGGSSYGNVYAVNRNGYFGPVCDDSWDDYDANVVCRYIITKKSVA